MRIAQVAPPLETVPPAAYGGTERVAHTITEELFRRGHEVTLFAAGGSSTSARLVVTCEPAAWHRQPPMRDLMPTWSLALGKLLREADRFDVVHSHLDWFGFPFARYARVPVVTTLHGRLDREYWAEVVKPMLGDDVEMVGEVAGEEKDAFLRNAAALLFPIRWPEPFGLVMVEALACGTPVVALRRGSVPEVIRDGVTGFIRDDEDGLVEAVGHLDEIDRGRCRAEAERRFSPAAMADRYE